jgi:hypothetical protein
MTEPPVEGTSARCPRLLGAIAVMLGKSNIESADSIRPELWARVEQLLAERAVRKRAERRDTR